MDCFSFRSLAWDLVSSLVTVMGQQWKGQRNLLDFCFHVKGSVSLYIQRFLMIATSILCSKWAFLNGQEGITLKHFLGAITTNPHLFLLPLPQLSFDSAIVGLIVFNPKFVRLLNAILVYSLTGESI